MPCLRKTAPAVCVGLTPTPSAVMMAARSGLTRNFSAVNRTTAENGADSGTLTLHMIEPHVSTRLTVQRMPWRQVSLRFPRPRGASAM